jgi:hypothetical protein
MDEEGYDDGFGYDEGMDEFGDAGFGGVPFAMNGMMPMLLPGGQVAYVPMSAAANMAAR